MEQVLTLDLFVIWVLPKYTFNSNQKRKNKDTSRIKLEVF